MLKLLTEYDFPVLPNVWLGTSVECRDYIYRIRELRKTPAALRFISFEPLIGRIGKVSLRNIDWAIVGGESGPSARPMDASWVGEILENCESYDTAFFFKQWGGTNKKKTGRKFRGKTWDNYPEEKLVAAE